MEGEIAKTRKRYSAEFKFKVALEAAKGRKTANELATEFGVHPNQISRWKQELLEKGVELFSRKDSQKKREEELRSALYEQIGRLKMELEWLKKELPSATEEKRRLIEPGHLRLSIRRQCELIGLGCSSWYYQPAGESEENLALMRLIDEQYTKAPFYGWRRMTAQHTCGG